MRRRKKSFEEEARFERGVNVPLEELPEELQENVEDPPPSVQRLKERMMDKRSSLESLSWAEREEFFKKLDNATRSWKFIPARSSHYMVSQLLIIPGQEEVEITINDEGIFFDSDEDPPKDILFSRFKRETLDQMVKRVLTHINNWVTYNTLTKQGNQKESRWERGKRVPRSKLPPEFVEMIDNPPESVLSVREEMMKKSSHSLSFEELRELVRLLQIKATQNGWDFSMRNQMKFLNGDLTSRDFPVAMKISNMREEMNLLLFSDSIKFASIGFRDKIDFSRLPLHSLKNVADSILGEIESYFEVSSSSLQRRVVARFLLKNASSD